MASRCRAGSVSGGGGPQVVCGWSALARGARVPPVPTWRGATPFPGRRSQALGRRRKPWRPGSRQGWRQARPVRAPAFVVPRLVGKRCGGPRGRRESGPAVGREAQRPGRNGCGGCAPLCMPHHRRRGWPHVGPRRRTHGLPCRPPEGGGSVRAPTKRRAWRRWTSGAQSRASRGGAT
jgi:hypothetical protein